MTGEAGYGETDGTPRVSEADVLLGGHGADERGGGSVQKELMRHQITQKMRSFVKERCRKGIHLTSGYAAAASGHKKLI